MLELKGVTKTYEDLIAVNDISFNIKKGEVLGLLGHNGAGKSTTIKMILGIIAPNKGEILWDGKPLRDSNIKMGYLPEERGLYEKTKVYDQLLYFGKLEDMNKKEINDSIDYWLNRLSISDYKYKMVKELSKGNKQKIQLIAAVLHDPELVILDEPFSGLDPINANVFAEIIQELIDKGKTIILSSHRMEQLDHFCKEIFILQKGKDILKGKIDEIKKNYGITSLEVKCDRDIEEQLKKNKIEFTKKGDTYHIPLKDDNEAINLLTSLKKENYDIRHFVMREPTLHEIFVEVVGK